MKGDDSQTDNEEPGSSNIILEERTDPPEPLPPQLRIYGDNSARVRDGLYDLNQQLASLSNAVEAAITAFHELDHMVSDFLDEDGNRIESLRDVLWAPLAEPWLTLGHTARRLKLLNGLLEELDLAIDSETSISLDGQARCARSAGDEWRAGVLWEAAQLRKRLVKEVAENCDVLPQARH